MAKKPKIEPKEPVPEYDFPARELREPPYGSDKVVDGVHYKCFNVEEYGQLGEIFISYATLWDYSLEIEAEKKSLTAELDLWKYRVDLWRESSTIQKDRAETLSKMFDEEHKLRLRVQHNDRLWRWLPWSLVVIESIAIGTIGIVSSAR